MSVWLSAILPIGFMWIFEPQNWVEMPESFKKGGVKKDDIPNKNYSTMYNGNRLGE